MTDWQTYLDERESASLEELADFLSIPSISALPEHAADVQRAGEWVVDRLRKAGVEHVQLMPTGGHPVVYGDWLHAPGRPTVLVYGHFDTQPVDPVELWDSPPFEPIVRNDRIYARGASDNKGNLLIPILAAEALLETDGALPVNCKFFFEGQEEIGSPQLGAFVRAHTELLRCDVALNADTGQLSEEQPGLLIALKGICGLEIKVTGANGDLHSGTFGGVVQNPLHAIVWLLDSMHRHDGSVNIEGFYDDVVPLTPDEREQIGRVGVTDEMMRSKLGVPALFGEPGYSGLERGWARPTLEVNGLWGGFQGEGTKTVIPQEAHAKITCRLVANQDGDRILTAIEEHIVSHMPPGVRVEVYRGHGTAAPYTMSADHWGNQAARRVLAQVYGVEPVHIRMGGSVPVTSLFLDALGVYTVGFAFGLEDEGIHAPNEFFRLKSFYRGQQAWALFMLELGKSSPA